MQGRELARVLDRRHHFTVDDDGVGERASVDDAMRRGVDGRRHPGSELADQDVRRLLIVQGGERAAVAADDDLGSTPDSMDSRLEPPRRRFECQAARI